MISKKEIQANKEKVIAALKSVDRPGIDDLVNWLCGSNFFTSPASTMFHGNYEGGLAAHSYKVYEEFWRQAQHYKLPVKQESAIIAGILHDCCKADYYIPNELKSGKISEAKPYKVDESFPIGHGEKSVIRAQRYITLTEQEAILIRWHMGNSDPAWEEYQDKVESLFPETVLFHHADKEVSLLYQL